MIRARRLLEYGGERRGNKKIKDASWRQARAKEEAGLVVWWGESACALGGEGASPRVLCLSHGESSGSGAERSEP